MRALVHQMSFVAGQLLTIVRILLRVLLHFFKANPYLTMGMVTGLLLTTPLGWIPLIGMFLVPVAIPLGFAIGAIAGHRMDRMRRGLPVSDQPGALFEYLLAAFKAILGLFGDIFRELRLHFSDRPAHPLSQVIEGDANRNDAEERRRKALEAAHQAARDHGYDLQQLLPTGAITATPAHRAPTQAPEVKGLIGDGSCPRNQPS